MKRAILLLVMAAALEAQTIYAGGVSFAPNADQRLAGTALMAKPLADATRAFVIFDAVPTSWKPNIVVTSNVGAGVGQRVVQFDLGGRNISVWVPASAGVSWSGKSVGWQWNGGLLIDVPLQKVGPWGVEPNVRFLKSSVSNNSDYQVIGGLLFRYKTGK